MEQILLKTESRVFILTISFPRILYSSKCKLIDKNSFELQLTTQAGTYIKEFVHSDLGRTEPNVGSLLTELDSRDHEIDITQLDVLELET